VILKTLIEQKILDHFEALPLRPFETDVISINLKKRLFTPKFTSEMKPAKIKFIARQTNDISTFYKLFRNALNIVLFAQR